MSTDPLKKGFDAVHHGEQLNGLLPIRQWAITQVTFPIAVGMIPPMREDWKTRLRRLIDDRKLSMKSASLNADLGETFVRDILERERDPSVGKLTKLAETLGLTIGELLDGVGVRPEPESEGVRELERVSNDEIFEQDPDFSEDDNSRAAFRALKRQLGPGEVVERDARGGLGLGGHASVITSDGVTFDAVSATWTFPVAFLHAELRARESDVDIIPVDGDSMIPTLLPGDRVMIQRSATRPSPDGLFAIDDGIGVSVKRLQIVRGSDPMMVRIISDNPQHATDTVLAESLKVIGRVICKVTRL